MSYAVSLSTAEDAILAWLEAPGYEILHVRLIAVAEPAAGRTDPHYRHIVLEGRLRRSLIHLNPDLPLEALEDAFRQPASRTLTSRRAASLGSHKVSEARVSDAHVTLEGPP